MQKINIRFQSKKFFISSGLTPLYIFLIGVTLVPFLMNIYFSFVDYYLVSPNKGQFIFFANYLSVINDRTFWKVLGTTFYFSLGSVTIQLVIGIIMAFLFNSIKEKIKFLRIFIILPLAISPVAISYSWVLMMDPSKGILNYLLSLIGVHPQLWFASYKFVIPSLLLVDTWQWLPFMVLVLTGAMLAQPEEPREAALVDGANFFQLARYVTLPLLKPTIIFMVIIRFIDAFKIFDTIYIITKGGPGNWSETLSIRTFKLGFNDLRMGEAAALSIIILIILFLIFQTIIKRTRIFE